MYRFTLSEVFEFIWRRVFPKCVSAAIFGSEEIKN